MILDIDNMYINGKPVSIIDTPAIHHTGLVENDLWCQHYLQRAWYEGDIVTPRIIKYGYLLKEWLSDQVLLATTVYGVYSSYSDKNLTTHLWMSLAVQRPEDNNSRWSGVSSISVRSGLIHPNVLASLLRAGEITSTMLDYHGDNPFVNNRPRTTLAPQAFNSEWTVSRDWNLLWNPNTRQYSRFGKPYPSIEIQLEEGLPNVITMLPHSTVYVLIDGVHIKAGFNGGSLFKKT